MKTLIIIVLMILSNLVLAQPESGKVLLSGSLQLTKSGSGKGSTTYTINPSIGFFTGDRNALGISAGFGRAYNYDPFNGGIVEINDFSIGAFNKKYFEVGGEEKFFFFLNSYFQYTKTKSPNTSNSFSMLGVSPGFSFFPASNVGIDFSVTGFAYAFPEGGGDGAFILDANFLSPTVGISFLLGGGKAD